MVDNAFALVVAETHNIKQYGFNGLVSLAYHSINSQNGPKSMLNDHASSIMPKPKRRPMPTPIVTFLTVQNVFFTMANSQLVLHLIWLLVQLVLAHIWV